MEENKTKLKNYEKTKPERELIRVTYVLRDMELPTEVMLTKKSMLRWFALAFGLVAPNDSRNKIIDILDIVFNNSFNNEAIEADQVYEEMKRKNIKVSNKLVRYHLKNLCDLGLLEKRGKKYFICSAEIGNKDDIKLGYEEKVATRIKKINDKIALALEKLKEKYKN
ncbi:MAG: hypothetical protein N3D73_02110 [Candidatus Diapherotrites archaeon]|nr:hypothetical protein [Candidatus Diapherotrites archaeon]